MKKILIKLILLFTVINAETNIEDFKCTIPDEVMEAILLNENGKQYPYYIRKNTLKDIKKFLFILSKYEYKKTNDKFLFDCLNKENCMNIAAELTYNDITNLDLGFYQINYGWFKENMNVYFEPELAYKKACQIVYDIAINSDKWDWNEVAKYHSRTPFYNNKYANSLRKKYKKIKNKNLVAKN